MGLSGLSPRLRPRLHPSLDFRRPLILTSYPGWGFGSLGISRY